MSRLVAQRYTAPVKPSPAQAPGFRAVKADVAAKRTRIAVHPPAAAESKASQDAAVAPPDDKEAQGKAANAEKMNAAKPGEFDKKAFVDAVNKAIDAQAPKNLDEADKFSKSGKADKVKDEVDGKVTDGKESSAKDIDTATKAPPDTSAAQDKEVTPLTPDQAPPNPGAPSASDAIPAKQPAAVTDFSEGPAANDQAMADAEITEEQLAKGNEPEFDEALSAKKTAETDSAKAPAKGRSAENQQLSSAKEGAAASGAQAMTALTATRAAAGKQVDGGKGDTKTKDEKKRAEVTAKLQKVYDGTKKDVEETLSGLDKKVDTAFTSGEKAARDAFTADHKRRMKKYKDKRYSGWTGKARWVKDKFAGLPKEANNLYQEARKLYVSQMQTVISAVADLIGTELGRAKARIAKGRTELKAEVDKLPADLKQFGEEAAKDFAGKFEDLEATVDEKAEQLVQDLANKYTAALNKIDEEIKKLQEANKGLIDKAMDAIVGVAKTINELKNLLFGILAKAGSAIMKILKDPIGFLGNLVKAVGAGLNLFITNIAEHLKTGVVSWLLGTAVKAGLELPQKFDLKGIIQLIGSLLGLTWDNIRARVTRKGVPDEAMTAVETSVPVAKNLAREGPAGAVKEIQAETGDLKATILSKLTSYLIPTVIIAGITWILSLLNPASAFIRAVKGIIDIVTFIVTQGAQIADFVNAVLDAVIAIANGGAAGVPKLVEAALATSVPLLIGFLASLLGIGGLANKVKSVFHAVSRPVNRAIDKIVDFIAKKGKALWNRPKSDKNDNGQEKKNPQSLQEKEEKLNKAVKAIEPKLEKELTSGKSTRLINAKLRGWKLLHKLKTLKISGSDGQISFYAAINPWLNFRSAYRPSSRELRRIVHEVAEDIVFNNPEVKERAAKIAEENIRPDHNTMNIPNRVGLPAAVNYLRTRGGNVPSFEQSYRMGEEGIEVREVTPAARNRRSISEHQAANSLVQPLSGNAKLETYEELAHKIRTTVGDDTIVASAIRSLITTGKIPHLPKLVDRQRISQLTWLMFGRESHRNVGNIAMAPMLLQLIESGKMTWEEAFSGLRHRTWKTGKTFKGGRGHFPMSMVGAQTASRRLMNHARGPHKKWGVNDPPTPITMRNISLRNGGRIPNTRRLQWELYRREIRLIEKWVEAKLEESNRPLGNNRGDVVNFIKKEILDYYGI
ncbi:hypothetical protein PUR49_27250 [Streptomyces sp. BE147]|uniref:phage tail protein n=1 Tax=Streptomyces sp. BE147 TaxID=3002524 RepID=UPI002E799112|nr:hypothetical protein [Streptomyces sp. BE147]MEE1740168.1 hypothetical protein [Streptomyces sp. BE147]